VSLSQLAGWLARPGSGSTAAATRPASGSTRAEPLVPRTEPPEAPKKKSLTDGETARSPVPVELTSGNLMSVWQEVLAQVGHFLANDLGKAISLAISGPNTLVLGFPTRYNLQREHCQEPANVERVEEALKKIAGRPWVIRIESSSRPEDQAEVRAANGEEASPAAGSSRRQRLEAAQKPLVRKVMEVMGAQIFHVDEGFGTAADLPPGTEET
jgi:DNA polymerase-3 subunit gamma/tau